MVNGCGISRYLDETDWKTSKMERGNQIESRKERKRFPNPQMLSVELISWSRNVSNILFINRKIKISFF